METIRKKTTWRCLEFKYKKHHFVKNSYAEYKTEPLIVKYYNSWDHETLMPEDQDVNELVMKHFKRLEIIGNNKYKASVGMLEKKNFNRYIIDDVSRR